MSIVYLSRRATFVAAHRLHSPLLSDAENQKIFGKCNNPNGHGHNYELEVIVRGPMDSKTGMLMNLAELKQIVDTEVTDRMDHKHLNLDVPEFKSVNPTAENMAIVFWNLLAPKLPAGLLHEIRLRETENNVVIYRGETG